jgi:hypothetical protein
MYIFVVLLNIPSCSGEVFVLVFVFLFTIAFWLTLISKNTKMHLRYWSLKFIMQKEPEFRPAMSQIVQDLARIVGASGEVPEWQIKEEQ